MKDIEQQVCADIMERKARGMVKYGISVADNPLLLKAWLQHQYEELLDAAIYCKRAIEEMEKGSGDWVGLTKDEVAELWAASGNFAGVGGASFETIRAVEAKLREKNHGN